MENCLLRVENLTKSFEGTSVLRGLSLSVAQGEFVTLLGPSGCGKTTTLRIIAGLTAPDQGRVFLDGRDVTSLPPEQRPVNTVFQNYALFPHMNVGRNIGYGLRLQRTPRGEIARRVKEMLDLVQLPGFENRMPQQLSGGQRQRVAIARAVVLGPKVLLLDEPLGALDLKLRQQMQGELKQLQKRLGITFVYITHDQEEALNMSDRIAVMNQGQFEQVGTPEQVYERPQTRFVAGFVGEGSLFEGVVEAIEGETVRLRAPSGLMLAPLRPGAQVGQPAAVSVHAERLRYAAQPHNGFHLPARVKSHRFAGSLLRTELELSTGEIVHASGLEPVSSLPPPGCQVYLYWARASAALIPGDKP